jgi:hypothetical protein
VFRVTELGVVAPPLAHQLATEPVISVEYLEKS